MHLFPGEYVKPVYGKSPKIRTYFYDKYTLQFDKLMKQYHHKITFLTGAHVHLPEVRASKDEVGNPYYAIFNQIAMSPLHWNNPGYSSVLLNDGKASDIRLTYLNLNETQNSEINFHTVKMVDFGLNEFTPQTAIDFNQRLQADPDMLE